MTWNVAPIVLMLIAATSLALGLTAVLSALRVARMTAHRNAFEFDSFRAISVSCFGLTTVCCTMLLLPALRDDAGEVGSILMFSFLFGVAFLLGARWQYARGHHPFQRQV